MHVDVRYATSGDGTRIAWSLYGGGDRTPLVSMRPPQFSHLEREWRSCVDSADFLSMAACEALTDLRPLLPQLRVPVLVLANPLFARMAPQDFNREGAAAIPDATLVSVGSARERVDAIRAFLDGGRPLPGSTSAAIPPATLPGSTLSRRELEVLRLIAAGYSNRGIAEALVLSVRTVDSHAARIYEKTQTRSRAEATAYAIRNGMLDQIP